MKSEETTSSNYALVAKGDNHGKKSHGKNLTCWKCGKPGHVKRNCPNKAGSAKRTDSERVHIGTQALVGIDARCVVEECRWLMNFPVEPTGRLHHKFQQGFVSTYDKMKFLGWFNSKWLYSYGGV
ncbi:hypothetical protein PIB30_086515 [Stylosanthes scabra]|uniref:CCHC-type domain-containing protein n=1 Tax=Stylosanthes scabra TaxID=79078 RepID=A0ABU6VRV5_9FABA|nr:hypothetical protein [Stylosanthes scabra]